jgi:oligogalacturonide lyase
MRFKNLAVMALAGTALLATSVAAKPQREWVDPLTHHRVLQISDMPGTSSLYFTQSAFTPRATRW